MAMYTHSLTATVAWQVLQESFDPIIDKATKENLLLLMTKAEVKGEYDYRGMYTALLTHQGRAVCAAVFRAFGAQLAEVPLVATKADARRQGHCRVLMTAFEVLLKEVKHPPVLPTFGSTPLLHLSSSAHGVMRWWYSIAQGQAWAVHTHKHEQLTQNCERAAQQA